MALTTSKMNYVPPKDDRPRRPFKPLTTSGIGGERVRTKESFPLGVDRSAEKDRRVVRLMTTGLPPLPEAKTIPAPIVPPLVPQTVAKTRATRVPIDWVDNATKKRKTTKKAAAIETAPTIRKKTVKKTASKK